MKTRVSLLFSLFFYSFTYAQPGMLDPTFGNGGKVITSVGLHDFMKDMAIQNDGKIIVAGYSTFLPNYDYYITLVRYNTDGSPDLTFDGDGKVATVITADTRAFAIALQNDGKIVVGGAARGANGTQDFLLVRYNTNGSLDNSFGNSGNIITSITPFSDIIQGITLQNDGKIMVTGFCNYNYNDFDSRLAVARYNINGKIDSTFSDDGVLIASLGSGGTYGKGIVLQNDGKMIVGGHYWNNGLTGWDLFLTRYNSNGTLDLSFDGDGIAVGGSNNSDDYADGMTVQSDGKILFAGNTGNNLPGDQYNTDITLTRFNMNGSPDLTFDGDGQVITPLGSSWDRANAVDVQSDGKIVVTGNALMPVGTGLNTDLMVARFNANGSLDMSFNGNGKVIISLQGLNDEGIAIKARSNRIYVAGTTYPPDGYIDIVLLAYQSGQLPLPVKLLHFSAVLNGSSVQCNWQTAQEVNTSHFTVQRSLDGAVFEDIGQVNALNNSPTSTYGLTDDLTSAIRQKPRLYYRLRISDNDGKFTYSSVSKIDIKPKDLFMVWPNPATEFIQINATHLQQIELFDANGKRMITKKANSDFSERLNVSNMPPGTYLLKIKSKDGSTKTEKVLIR